MTRGLNNKGQVVLVGMVVLLLVLALGLPVLLRNVMSESNWTVKQQRSTRALQMAEAAVEQGYQKLTLNASAWDDARANMHIDGYDLDQVYTNPSGGQFAIEMDAKAAPADSVFITGVGRDHSEIRAIKALYRKDLATDSDVGLYTFDVGGSGSPMVYWGALVSKLNMRLTGSAAASYPLLYAGGSIQMAGWTPPAPFLNTKCLSGDPPPYEGGPTGQPPPLAYQWNCNYDVPTQPLPNFAYYKQLAIDQGNICAGQSCFNGGWKFSLSLVDPVCTDGLGHPKVWFAESGDVNIAGDIYFCGVLIAQNGSVMLTGLAKAPEGNLVEPIPTNAWMQYQAGTPNGSSYLKDTVAKDEYPGDDGYRVVKANYDFAVGGGGFLPQPVMFKGFIYAGKGYQVAGNTVIVGAVETGPSSSAMGAGNYSIFFNKQIIKRGSSIMDIRRDSWREQGGCIWGNNPPDLPTCP